MAIRLAVAGAAGRMGQRLIALARDDSDLRCVAALESAGHPAIGRDAGEAAGIGRAGLAITDHLAADADVVADFSTPAGTLQRLSECRARSIPMVIGTTGHTPAELDVIRAAARSVAIVKSPNMSVGINLLLRIVEQMAMMLDESYDVEIVETHHRFKADAPSGTALALRDAVSRGRYAAGGTKPVTVFGRHGATARPVGEIGIHSLRIGDTIGDHSVFFGGFGETLSVGHVAHSRDTFAAGALRAAKWLVGRSPGLYDMQDVLFADRRPPPKEKSPD